MSGPVRFYILGSYFLDWVKLVEVYLISSQTPMKKELYLGYNAITIKPISNVNPIELSPLMCTNQYMHLFTFSVLIEIPSYWDTIEHHFNKAGKQGNTNIWNRTQDL